MGLRHAAARHPVDHGRRRARRVAGSTVAALAALSLLAPLPPGALIVWRGLYARSQPAISRASARLPLATLDLWLLVLAGLGLWALWRRRADWRLRWTIVPALVVWTALAWLVFLAAWGWHYQVPTLETRLMIAPAALTPQTGTRFAAMTVRALNRDHAAAHAAGWPTRAAMPIVLAPHLARVLPALGVSWTPAWPVPRETLIDPYFRWAGIDGMTNPFGLDVVLNSRALPIEVPALTAHEYAHLAGFADESDASVVAWLACRDGGPPLRYSAALAVLPHLVAGLPGPLRRSVLDGLDEGPRADLRAIAARLDEQQPWVHALAWQTYDRFLKANRVGEGVARYDAVARVLIAAADPVTGRLRRVPSQWPPAPGR
ncbi:MAG: DUF3810 family protein [Luteitalea sp.]